MIKAETTKLKLYNRYGLVYEDCFYVLQDNKPKRFDLGEVKQINFETKRQYKLNYLLFFISFLPVLFYFLMFESLQHIKILSCLVSLLLFFFALLFKKYDYRLLIVTMNFRLIPIKVDIDFKNEAKEIAEEVGEKLNLKEQIKISL